MRTCVLRLGAIVCVLFAASVWAEVRYVDVNGANPTAPYTNWATAAVTIQEAVDAASAGDLIVVTNGVYRTGGRVHGGALTNRVVVDKAVAVRSVNGAGATFIEGYQVPGSIIGDTAVRCMYLTNGVVLSGFTITNGATFVGENDTPDGGDTSGAGILCESRAVTISNCVFVGNVAGDYGGGVLRGTLWNCLFFNNTAESYGGGTFDGNVNNCTVTGNFSFYGGGDAFSTLNNCILYDNDPDGGGNYSFSGLNYCCTLPDPGGVGNITNAPLFIDATNGDFHLQTNSPCINAGNNSYTAAGGDLDGNARIAGGTADMGAYEFQAPTSSISYAWLQQYKLATDGSVDHADTDGDGMNNFQEWLAGTDPTDALSILKMLPLVAATDMPGMIISWQSVSSRNYTLQFSADLRSQPVFVTVATNIAGQDGTTSYADTNAVGNGPFFYRVSVR